MFIKIKEEDGDEIRINVNHIISYVRDTEKPFTLLHLIGDHVAFYNETPEQIDAKLAKLGISVGGEY